MRTFSLYGVNQDDRVTACEHFAAPTTQEAIRRAQAQVRRFHKVELWERSACVFEEVRTFDEKAAQTALGRARSWFRLAWQSPRNEPGE